MNRERAFFVGLAAILCAFLAAVTDATGDKLGLSAFGWLAVAVLLLIVMAVVGNRKP